MIEKLNGTTETVDFMVSTTVRMYHNNTPENFPTHWHLPGEIICPIENSYQTNIAGQDLTLLPHDVLIIASGELHTITAPPTGERYILNFSTPFFEQFQEFSRFFSTLRPFKLLRHADAPDLTDQLFDQLAQMETEYFGQNDFHDCEIASQMLHFFALIGRHYHRLAQQVLATPKQQEQQERFTELCNYISSHCTESLSLEDLANEAGFSKYHFARLFKEMTGTTCHNFVLGRRIIYAKNLLMDFSLPITEVAMRAGFNSLATFNRIFKAQIGCTPSEFRKLGSSVSLS